MISDAALQEFKKLWIEELGEEISDEEAMKLGANLLTLFHHIYRPVKKDWLVAVTKDEKPNNTYHYKTMKSLERRFNSIAEKTQNWSSYLCFAEAIREQGFSEQVIRRWFNKLVDKDDYAKNEKRGVLDFLVGLSNPVRTTGNGGKSAP